MKILVMPETTIDFERDTRAIFVAMLDHNDDLKTTQSLRSMNAIDLVIQYLNWRNRLIEPKPRKIFRSSAIDKILLAKPEHRADFEALCEKISTGGNILPHLSERISTPYRYRPVLKPLVGRRDYDMLLNDWGIHHLHLGQDPDPRNRGFLRRGKALLFGIFRDTEAYLIDIKDHEDFANEELVRIAIASWPQLPFFIPLKGVLPGTPWTSNERKGLRSFGHTTTIDVDGVCYLPGLTLGITTTGISLRLVKEAQAFVRAVRGAEMQCLDAAFTLNLYRRAGLKIGQRSVPRLGMLIDGWGVVDQATDAILARIRI